MLSLSFYFPRPKAMKKGPREPRAIGADLDNLCKAVMDAANGVLFADDRQVVELQARKWVCATGSKPRVEVVVGPWREFYSNCGAGDDG
jgi:Holliday junction resolvase RusA-like endonuclease